MAQSSPEDLPPFHKEFCDWLKVARVYGIDGNRQNKTYIPPGKLREFWKADIVKAVLVHYGLSLDANVICDSLLQVLSTLYCISERGRSRVQCIQDFAEAEIEDQNLPMTAPTPNLDPPETPPAPFTDQLDGRRTWHRFVEYQWQFCPIRFRTGTRLIGRTRPAFDPRCIRPVTIERDLRRRSPGRAVLSKAISHESSGLKEKYIVIKEYEGDLECEFTSERNTYLDLRNQVPPDLSETYFLRYFGSFIQGNRGVILLEYAEEGSLLDFYKKGLLPNEDTEVQSMWESLMKTTSGLVWLHGRSDPLRNVISSVHQDIKPANIFVTREPQTRTDEYRFRFKLGDLGLCYATQLSAAGEPLVADNKGEKVYSAPELCKEDQSFASIKNYVTPTVDVWSLGAVLFEAAVWINSGERGRQEFLQMRKSEVKDQTDLCDAGYDAAFHNGRQPLQALQRIRNTIEQRPRAGNAVTVACMDCILNNMLLADARQRLVAEQLPPRFRMVLDSASPLSPTINALNSMSLESRPSSVETRQLSPSHCGILGQSLPPPSRTPSATNGRLSTLVAPTWTSLASTTDQDHLEDHSIEGTYMANTYHPSGRLGTSNECSRGFGNDCSHCPMQLTLNGTADWSNPTWNCMTGPMPGETMAVPGAPQSQSEAPQNSSGSSNEGHNISSQHQKPRPPARHRISMYPEQTIRGVNDWIPNHKKDRSVKLDRLDDVRRRIANRDQCFIIDDSPTMHSHWQDVRETFKALSYLVKHVDPDGMEMCFTSNPTFVDRQKHTKPLLKNLEAKQPETTAMPTTIESALDTILCRVIDNVTASRGMPNGNGLRGLVPRRSQRRTEGVNVYVFTDGVWEPGVGGEVRDEAGGVDRTIRSIIERLRRLGLPRTFLTLQFIRFGHDEDGKRRLKYLDDDFHKIVDGGWDIVDTRYFGDPCVWQMIIGAISSAEDGAAGNTSTTPG